MVVPKVFKLVSERYGNFMFVHVLFCLHRVHMRMHGAWCRSSETLDAFNDSPSFSDAAHVAAVWMVVKQTQANMNRSNDTPCRTHLSPPPPSSPLHPPSQSSCDSAWTYIALLNNSLPSCPLAALVRPMTYVAHSSGHFNRIPVHLRCPFFLLGRKIRRKELGGVGWWH